MERFIISITVALGYGTAAQFLINTPDQPMVAAVGSDVTLPCTISPSLSAAGLKVRWFRDLYHNVVFLLSDGREDRQQQMSDYRGRASLLSGPDRGNLSLSLRAVQLTDAGTYHCFVESNDSSFDEEGKMVLNVVGVGTPPLVGVSVEDSSVVLSCSSDGWFPEPSMFWMRGNGETVPTQLQARKDSSSGLFHIQSDIHLQDSSDGQMYCGLRHPVTKEETGVYVAVSDAMFPRFSTWAIVFGLLLVLSTAGLAVGAWFFYKKQLEKGRLLQERDEYAESLKREIEWRKISITRESVLFDPLTAYSGLQISPDRRTIRTTDVIQEVLQNPERFDTEPCALGETAFRSGTHYWETEVLEETEKFWSLGIAGHSVRRIGGQREAPESLIWAIRGTAEHYYGLSSQAEEITLVQRRPPSEGSALLSDVQIDEPRRIQKVGIYLDYDGGRVSFYDVDTYQRLYTFTNTFDEPVYPFYYVGPGIAFINS